MSVNVVIVVFLFLDYSYRFQGVARIFVIFFKFDYWSCLRWNLPFLVGTSRLRVKSKFALIDCSYHFFFVYTSASVHTSNYAAVFQLLHFAGQKLWYCKLIFTYRTRRVRSSSNMFSGTNVNKLEYKYLEQEHKKWTRYSKKYNREIKQRRRRQKQERHLKV